MEAGPSTAAGPGVGPIDEPEPSAGGSEEAARLAGLESGEEEEGPTYDVARLMDEPPSSLLLLSTEAEEPMELDYDEETEPR